MRFQHAAAQWQEPIDARLPKATVVLCQLFQAEPQLADKKDPYCPTTDEVGYRDEPFLLLIRTDSQLFFLQERMLAAKLAVKAGHRTVASWGGMVRSAHLRERPI